MKKHNMSYNCAVCDVKAQNLYKPKKGTTRNYITKEEATR